MHAEPNNKLPFGLKIATGYLAFVGVSGLLWPLFNLGPHYVEFARLSAASQLGVQARGVTFNALFLLAGIGLFRRKTWARKLALVLLPISTIYATNDFAWGLMHGRPNFRGYAISFAFAAVWNAIWFWLIVRPSTKNALFPTPPSA